MHMKREDQQRILSFHWKIVYSTLFHQIRITIVGYGRFDTTGKQ